MTDTGRFRVGTSGWNYPDWKPDFYPEDTPKKRFLEAYAQRFDAVELNATFYRLPTDNAVTGWRDRVPDEFRYSVKLSRYLTHQKRLKDADEGLETFLDRLGPMQDRIGAVLAQLPASLAFDDAPVDAFLSGWRRRTRLPLAIEARDDSWFSDEAIDLMEKSGVALVQADSGDYWPSTRTETADFVYLRYHGPDELYSSGYTPQKLGAEAERIADWLADGREVWAFFNNTDAGHAWSDAERLRRLVRKRMD